MLNLSIGGKLSRFRAISIGANLPPHTRKCVMITGSLPALVTPFTNGQVDRDALKKLVNWHVDQGRQQKQCVW